MTPVSSSEAANDLKNFLDLLVDADIAQFRTPVIPQPLASTGIVRVSWPDRGTGLPWRDPVESPLTYRRWVESGAYSALLFDGALLQLTFDYRRDELVRHRLAYWPCPYSIDRLALSDDNLQDLLQLYEDEPAIRGRMVSALRFDFDRDAATVDHPAGHVTLLNSAVRIPTAGAVSIGLFIRFVFRHFYPVEWRAQRFLREWPLGATERLILEEHLPEIHFNWVRASG